jgi:hypothetical protein
MDLRLAAEEDFYGDEVLGEDFNYSGFLRLRFFLLGFGEPDFWLTLGSFFRTIYRGVALAD